jgi:hypothetical protein
VGSERWDNWPSVAMGRMWRRAKCAVLMVAGAALVATAVTRHVPKRGGGAHDSAIARPGDGANGALAAVPASSASAEGFYALSARDIDGVVVPLSRYAGRVSIVANVASF